MTMVYFQKIAPALMLDAIPNPLDKPVVGCWIGDKAAQIPADKMRAGGIPTFNHIDSALDAAFALFQRGRFLEREKKNESVVSGPKGAREKALALFQKSGFRPNERVSKQVLSLYGIPVPQGAVVTSAQQGGDAARTLGYPVVAKALCPTIFHKTDLGVIRTGISDEEELEGAIGAIEEIFSTTLASHEFQGVLIEKQYPPPLAEVIAGTVFDETGVHKILFGLGGIFVEVLKDSSVRLAPIRPMDAKEMIREIKGAAILSGVRGKSRADLAALGDVLLRFSALAWDFKDQLLEIDINPLFAYETGTMAVDALIRFKHTDETPCNA